MEDSSSYPSEDGGSSEMLKGSSPSDATHSNGAWTPAYTGFQNQNHSADDNNSGWSDDNRATANDVSVLLFGCFVLYFVTLWAIGLRGKCLDRKRKRMIMPLTEPSPPTQPAAQPTAAQGPQIHAEPGAGGTDEELGTIPEDENEE